MKARTVLAIFANPSGSEELRLSDEERAIRQAVRRSRAVTIVTRHAVTVDDLQISLREHKPHIVHISAHGLKEGFVLHAQRERGLDGEEHAALIAPDRLAQQLAAEGSRVEGLVVNACYSAVYASDVANFKFPWVIAMSDEVSDDGAIAFSSAFYDALADGHDVKPAYDEAIRNLQMKEKSDYSIIELYLHPELEKKPFRLIAAVLALPLLLGLLGAAFHLFGGKPSMNFFKVVDDDALLRFSLVNKYREAVTVRDVRVTADDPEITKHLVFGELAVTSTAPIPKEKEDGVVDIGVEHIIWKPENALANADAFLSANETKRLHFTANAFGVTVNEALPMSCEATLGQLAPFLKRRGTDCELTPEGCQ